MRRKRLAAIEARLRAAELLLDKVDRSLERIELVTVVREPNTAMSADAYDGLRKQVIASVGERMSHLHQLAQFHAALRADATAHDLDALVREWMGQASLEIIDDPTVEEAFEFIGPEKAATVRVLRPAYVDAITHRLVKGGVAERVEPESPVGGAAKDEGTETVASADGGGEERSDQEPLRDETDDGLARLEGGE